jgi:hypothetical protein
VYLQVDTNVSKELKFLHLQLSVTFSIMYDFEPVGTPGGGMRKMQEGILRKFVVSM